MGTQKWPVVEYKMRRIWTNWMQNEDTQWCVETRTQFLTCSRRVQAEVGAAAKSSEMSRAMAADQEHGAILWRGFVMDELGAELCGEMLRPWEYGERRRRVQDSEKFEKAPRLRVKLSKMLDEDWHGRPCELFHGNWVPLVLGVLFDEHCTQSAEPINAFDADCWGRGGELFEEHLTTSEETEGIKGRENGSLWWVVILRLSALQLESRSISGFRYLVSMESVWEQWTLQVNPTDIEDEDELGVMCKLLEQVQTSCKLSVQVLTQQVLNEPNEVVLSTREFVCVSRSQAWQCVSSS